MKFKIEKNIHVSVKNYPNKSQLRIAIEETMSKLEVGDSFKVPVEDDNYHKILGAVTYFKQNTKRAGINSEFTTRRTDDFVRVFRIK
jgi:hypothetical protein